MLKFYFNLRQDWISGGPRGQNIVVDVIKESWKEQKVGRLSQLDHLKIELDGFQSTGLPLPTPSGRTVNETSEPFYSLNKSVMRAVIRRSGAFIVNLVVG